MAVKYLLPDDGERLYIFNLDVYKNDGCLFAVQPQIQILAKSFPAILQTQPEAYSYCYGNLLRSYILRNTFLFFIRHDFKT